VKLKVYVSHALSDIPKELKQEFLSDISRLKEALREHFEVLEYLGTVDGTAEDVYRHDMGCVEAADFLILICDFASTVMGYEAAVGIELRKIPTFGFAHERRVLSRWMQGIDIVRHPHYQFRRYGDILEVAAMVRERVAEPKIA
jgi:hypothetical protein